MSASRRSSSGRARVVYSEELNLGSDDDDDDGPTSGGRRKRQRRSSPGGAITPALRAGTRGAAAAEAASNEPKETAEQRLLAVETPLERASVVLDCLAEIDHLGWFAQPVTEEDVPGYTEIIETPMDLGTIRSKLNDGAYTNESLEPFLEDVRLIVHNAVTFNWQPGHDVAEMAVRLLSAFEGWLPLLLEGKEARGASAYLGGTATSAVRKVKVSRAPQPRRSDEEHHRRLVLFVEACGGTAEMLVGWKTHTDVRGEGHSAGTTDTYFIPPVKGARLRSKAEVARYLKLDYNRGQAYLKKEREEAKAAAKELENAEKAALRQAKQEARLSMQGEMQGGGGGGGLTYTDPGVDDTLLHTLPPLEEPLPPPPSTDDVPSIWMPGMPASSASTLLTTSDFLRVGSEALRLPYMGGPKQLAATLLSSSGSSNDPLLSSLHSKLLRLILSDNGCNAWWKDPIPSLPLFAQQKAVDRDPWWVYDAQAPFECDEASLINAAVSEEKVTCKRWIDAVEGIAHIASVDKNGGRVTIIAGIEEAANHSRCEEVSSYLRSALTVGGPALGKTCGLWLAAQVRHARPMIFAAASESAAAAADGDAQADSPSQQPPEVAVKAELPIDEGQRLWSEEQCLRDGYDWQTDFLPSGFVDRRMGWVGANAEGWRCRPRGKLGRKSGTWQWLAPWGEVINTLAIAKDLSEAYATAQAKADAYALEQLREQTAVRLDKASLVGRMLATRRTPSEPWRTALVTAYDASSGKHSLKYQPAAEAAEVEAEAAVAAAQAAAAAGAGDGDAEMKEEEAAPSGAKKGPGVVGEFIVESIVSAKGRGRGRRYEVKWQGFGHHENTWEPPSHLHPQLIAEFEQKASKESGGKVKGRSPSSGAAKQEVVEVEGDGDGSTIVPAALDGMHCALFYPISAPSLAANGGGEESLPPRPLPKHVTSLSWHKLTAAAAIRLHQYWGLPDLSPSNDIGDADGFGSLRQAVSLLLECPPYESDYTYSGLPPASKLSLLSCLTSAACDTAAANKAFGDAHSRWVDACSVALEAKREARRYRDEQRVEVRLVMEGSTTKPWIKTEAVDGEEVKRSPRRR